MAARSKHRLKGKIVKIRRGVAIYQTHAGPYYYARILHPKTGKYVVRSTKETSRLEARKVAEELAYDMRKNDRVAEPEYSFKYYAQRYIEKARGQAQRGERNANYVRTATVALDNDDWGLVRHFATRDVRELKTKDWQLFIEKITAKRPDLSSSTRNTLMAAFRNVMKVVRDDGLVDVVPDMRIANTMEGAVAPYKRLCERYPEATGEDYLFLPQYENRATAARVIARQFNKLMEETGLKMDAVLQTERTIYSLRHTAICMRIILSQGKVNIFNLAKNAGTSVSQIERFYARNLPLSPELAKNLQSFGE